MTLDEYLKINNISNKEFGKSIEPKTSRQTIWAWRRGLYKPNYYRRMTIEKVTNGKVTPDSFDYVQSSS